MHASYAAKLPVVYGKKCGYSYHSKNCTGADSKRYDVSPERTAELRAAWVAIGGAKVCIPNGTRRHLLQSEIKGANCCKSQDRCEWLEYHRKTPCKCGWFGDELTRVSKTVVARLPDCFTETVPPKETEE
jgi:hypothetical protein